MTDENKDLKDNTEHAQQSEPTEPVIVAPPQKVSRVRSFFRRAFATKKRRAVSIAVIVVLVVIILLAFPLTRYTVAAPFIKKDVDVTLRDQSTGRPVSDASVALGNTTARTDKDGKATLRKVAVGQYTLTVSKQFYKTSSSPYEIELFAAPKQESVRLTALGRQVSITVTDKITAKPLADAKLTVSSVSTITDTKGTATIVLSPDKDTQTGVVAKTGYNSSNVTISLSDSSKNNFSVTANGSLVYLSNKNGTIDVVRANLAGSNSSVIVKGTGKENKYSTSLLSAQDWKYSVLKASRDDDKEKLYLVNTAQGTNESFDEGDATFSLIGWSGHDFYYQVNRNGKSDYADKAIALKSYNADTGAITTVDETGATTAGGNTDSQYYSAKYLIGDELVFMKMWQNGYYNANGDSARKAGLYAASTKTGKVTLVKEFPQAFADLSTALYEPLGLYVTYQPSSRSDSSAAYYEYEDGELKSIDKPDSSNTYATYLYSPSGNKTLWYEIRDGKNTIFIGDKAGKNGKQIASLSEYVPYGWYGSNDQCILFTKNGSELYIAPADGVISDSPLKVTDYYKTESYPGYGKGYGGQ